MITKDTVWTTRDGRKIKLKDLEDTHLSNLIDFLNNSYSSNKNNIMLIVLNEIVAERGLQKEFLNRSQIPYKNQNNKWEIWDKEKGFLEVQKRSGQQN